MQIAALALVWLCSSVVPQGTAEAEAAAWDAALALKQKGAYRDAANAFEEFTLTFATSPRALGARVEAGVCRFSLGRSALKLYRITPEAKTEFDAALKFFGGVMKDFPETPAASRSAYMQGSTYYFAGDLGAAEAAYDLAYTRYGGDTGYVAKALERRAFVRRHLLEPELAIADMELWLKRFGKTDASAPSLQRELALARSLGKPAPLVQAESWPAGPPAPLELLGGHVVALYFFATWCPNCAKELPFVLDLAERYTPRDVRFVGVMDHQKAQTHESVAKYASANRVPFSVMMNDGSASVTYGVSAIPHLILIDREGRMRWRDNPSNLSDWTLEALLGEGLEVPAPPDER